MIDPGRVAIIYNSKISEAYALAAELANKLNLAPESRIFPAYGAEEMEFVDNPSLIITIGGDGTILWAAQIAAPIGVPILGINMGAVGFMAELSPNEAMNRIGEYLNGETRLERRNMIMASMDLEDGLPQSAYIYNCLNEIVVGRGNISRPVYLETYVDDNLTFLHHADAVIVSTATGSTGYSLSAGGPILHPESTDMIINPVASHVGLSSALVVPDASSIRVKNIGEQVSFVSVDGRFSIELKSERYVTINKSNIHVTFLRSHSRNYFYPSLLQRLKIGFNIRNPRP